MADTPRTTPSPEDLRRRLSPEQWHVTQEAGTERPFTGEYWNVWDDGKYHCIVCDAALFDADTKFDAGCGWPSFYQPLDTDAVTYLQDTTYGMVRTEVRCATCGAHLGHVFPDGPAPTGDRFCMNSASLRLLPAAGGTADEAASMGAEQTEGSDA